MEYEEGEKWLNAVAWLQRNSHAWLSIYYSKPPSLWNGYIAYRNMRLMACIINTMWLSQYEENTKMKTLTCSIIVKWLAWSHPIRRRIAEKRRNEELFLAWSSYEATNERNMKEGEENRSCSCGAGGRGESNSGCEDWKNQSIWRRNQ